MRIGGYGAGFGPQDEGARDRAAAFRARHSIGQRVRGRVLRREAGGLFWVLVGGEELLARLEVQAEPGQQLFFMVRALTPEIVLQALPGGAEAGDLPGLVQRFRAAREQFENRHAPVLLAPCSAPAQAQERRAAFDQALAAHPEAGERHAAVLGLLDRINALAGERAEALYLPWLLPGLRRQEMLRRELPGNVQELALGASDQDCGQLEARLLRGPEQPRLRVYAERPEQATGLLPALLAWAREEAGAEPELLGPLRLKPSPLGGILGELFAQSTQWSPGGLNARV